VSWLPPRSMDGMLRLVLVASPLILGYDATTSSNIKCAYGHVRCRCWRSSDRSGRTGEHHAHGSGERRNSVWKTTRTVLHHCHQVTAISLPCRSTLRQNSPNKAGLKCPSVRTYVHPSTKGFFDFNEIWHFGRGWWVMHDSMQYDSIQGQGQEPLKLGNAAIFNSYILRHLQWELATDDGLLN